MTDDDTSTRPISVAELLAKNGTIGAPPVGGRRRRRRGNSDAVTVAELTGEIPILTDDAAATGRVPVRRRTEPVVVEEPAEEPDEDVPASQEPVAEPEPVLEVEPVAELEPADPADPADLVAETEVEPEPELEAGPGGARALTEAEADYAAHLQRRDVDPDPIEFAAPSRRTPAAKLTGSFPAQVSGAEQMSPDPVVDDDEMLDLGPDVDFNEVLDKHASTDGEADGDDSDDSDDEDEPVDEADAAVAREDLPTYLRSNSDTLFGGQSVADDLARRGPAPGPGDVDLGGATEARPENTAASGDQGGSAFVRGAWVVAQCILAVAFGAGLFIAFDQLWRWNTIVALVLSVLVILGLVVGVRVVRKTEDIGSTLIAVAVGALVTLGPLALLQSH